MTDTSWVGTTISSDWISDYRHEDEIVVPSPPDIPDDYGIIPTDNVYEIFAMGPATETVELSDLDFAFFTNTLANPPEPNEKLRKIFEEWDK